MQNSIDIKQKPKHIQQFATTNTKQTTNTARLTLQTIEIAPETTAIRCLDWDRDRFDIEFGLQNGTTYNSFIIQGEKLALVDTTHAKFRQLYLELLTGLIDPARLDYLTDVTHLLICGQ